MVFGGNCGVLRDKPGGLLRSGRRVDMQLSISTLNRWIIVQLGSTSNKLVSHVSTRLTHSETIDKAAATATPAKEYRSVEITSPSRYVPRGLDMVFPFQVMPRNGISRSLGLHVIYTTCRFMTHTPLCSSSSIRQSQGTANTQRHNDKQVKDKGNSWTLGNVPFQTGLPACVILLSLG